VKCKLCDSDAKLYAKSLYEHNGRSYSLARCSSCGIVFVDPFPTEAETRGFYDERYFSHDYSFGIVEGDYLASEAARADEYRKVLSRIARLTNGRRLLEVGCAAGGFLKEARSQGWKVTGVDVSEWAAKTAHERFGLDVRLGALQEMNFPDSSFDAVLFSDLLEHLPDPVGFLREVARVVEPRDRGGVVVAKVPTYINSFYYRWARIISRLMRLNKRHGNLISILKLSDTAMPLPPYHLFEHNPGTARDVFTRAGLEVFDEFTTLMVPEFLRTRPFPSYKILLALFSMLKLFIESFGLPGGHVFIYAARGKAT
jgi:SAM-dependent methyltransferase